MRGVYAITDEQLITENQFLEKVEQSLRGGVHVVQYRNKHSLPTIRFNQAQSLLALCRSYQVPLIINDDVMLAKQIGADGVHLGKTDRTIAVARTVLGNQAIIGASCYNQLNLAEQAVKAGANYIAFGRFFPSRTKPEAVPASLDLLTTARALFSCPIVAIGGITPENAASLIAAGADCVAVIHGIFGQKQIQTETQRYVELFHPTVPTSD